VLAVMFGPIVWLAGAPLIGTGAFLQSVIAVPQRAEDRDRGLPPVL
jgi:hypothetical protein